MQYTDEDKKIITDVVNEARYNGTTSGVFTKASKLTGHSAESIRKYARNILKLDNVRPNIQSDAKLIENKIKLDGISKEVEKLSLVNGLPNYEKMYNNSKIISDNITFIGDLHSPYWRRKTIDNLVYITGGKDRDLLIGGDIHDFPMLASQKIRVDIKEDIEEVFIQTSHLIKYFLENYRRVFLLPGNHDKRIEVISQGKLSWKIFFLELLDVYENRLSILDFPRVQINDDWIVHHPDTYSKTPGKVARDFAVIEMKNEICTHSHTTNFSISPNNKLCYDIGGAVDRDLIAYTFYTDKAYPKWTNGFLTLINGTPKLYTQGIDFD